MITNGFEYDQYVKNWFTGLAKRTIVNYLREFPKWLSFIKMNPTEQINKRLKDLTSQNLIERTFFENKFREYKQALEKEYEEDGTVKTMLRTVASFFGRNGLRLNLNKGDWKSTREGQRVKPQKFKATQETVKAMYAHANLRDRSLLLVLAQSGLSEIDVSEFQIEDIKDLYIMPQSEHYFFEKPREKSNELQATCISYEALHDIRNMLSERGNPTQGYLFVSQTKAKGEQIDTRRINEAMKTLAEKTFGTEKAKEFKTKSLRGFYNSALLRASIQPQEIKDVMMGHARLSARKNYPYDDITIKENYVKAFEHLSINGVQSREDLAELRNAFNTTKIQLAELITELKDRNDKLEAKLTELGVDVNTIKETTTNLTDRISYIEKKTKIHKPYYDSTKPNL